MQAIAIAFLVGTLCFLRGLRAQEVQEISVDGEACGDVNGDESTDISDAVYLLNFLFLSGPPPVCIPSTFDPADGGGCGLSARLAAGACRQGALARYRLAVARCANLAKPYEIGACLESARKAFDEALEECDGQTDARIGLCDAIGDGPYEPAIDPTRFVDGIDNPYLPLIPGTTFVYEKRTLEGTTERTSITVTHEKRNVLGVDCTVIFETESEDGDDEEETVDWFAQDVEGNVWHLGGRSYAIADGETVDVVGSWEAGIDGARPGIAMLAAPAPGRVYRQHLALAEAEDAARVVAVDATAEVPHGKYGGCLVTEDFTPLEPSFREHKVYAPGVGLVLEVDLETGERVELLEIRRE